MSSAAHARGRLDSSRDENTVNGVLSLEEARAALGGIPPARRLEVEIGCGNGHFLAEYARTCPDTILVGVDLKADRCGKAARKLSRVAHGRAFVVRARAEDLLSVLAEGSVDAFHIYFPDPWPKSRHRRRRLLRLPQLDVLHAKLRPGGLLYFATDFSDYCVQVKVLLLVQGGFALERATPPPQAFASVFGRKLSERGRRIHTLVARRCENTPPSCSSGPDPLQSAAEPSSGGRPC